LLKLRRNPLEQVLLCCDIPRHFDRKYLPFQGMYRIENDRLEIKIIQNGKL